MEPMERWHGGTLPRSLEPLTDESLPGFLLRLSYRLEQPPAEIAAVTGLAPDGILGSGLLLAIPPETIIRFSSATRLSTRESRSLTLSSMGDRYPPLDLAADGRMRQAQGATGLIRWIFTNYSRYCPECLSGSATPAETLFGGSWRKTWRLPVTIACQQHGRLLEHLCPQCHVPVHHITGTGLILRPADILHPAQCRSLMPGAEELAPRHRTACGARLDHAGHGPERRPASGLALELQQHLSSMFGLQEDPEKHLDSRRDLSRYLQDLRVVSCLITMTWPLAQPLMPADPALAAAFGRYALSQQEDIEERRLQGRRVHALALYDTPPLDAAACAGLLLAADALVRPEPARDDIGALVAAAYPATALRTFFKDVREFCSVSLRETIETEMGRLHPPDQRGEMSRLRKKASFPKIASDGWTSYHRRRGHLVVRPQGDWRFDYRHVPQRLPDEWTAAHFSGGRDIHPRHLHITAAIRLVQMTSGGSEIAAGESLGIPRGTARPCVHHVRVWTRDPANSERFAVAVRDFAEHLHHSATLIDYARRRARLLDWIIPQEEWEQITARMAAIPGLDQPRSESQRRRRLFSVLAWTTATGGDQLLAPLVLAEPRTASQLRQDLAQVRYRVRTRPHRFAAALAKAAEDYGANLADAIDGGASCCQ